ncbi:hypothetical protein KFK09_024554 [Dendrobium nobile]|uniref:Reverse transcriptase Ty1/copia-type domain-containing protein n=1 Tax=Dendrobium nobile TaxID=94219 RepID=A0A8T3AE29_DENNO|nr:hypothetical protein KFK09_024554 [Dendrobium nobile]
MSTIFLLIYVDDILITGNNSLAISDLLQKLHTKFAMKHLGQAHSFLGIQITSRPNQYFLSQPQYANSILQIANMTSSNSLANPTCTKLPQNLVEDPILSDRNTYRKITGSLQYLTITRPDISYSVNILSQHMHNLMPPHIYLLKRLLRYIHGMQYFGIPFSDANWARDLVSRKSTSGFCSFLGTTLISRTVKKQHTVARSSTESEYRALAAATADLIWLLRILADFQVPLDKPTDLYCDNTSYIALANNLVYHARKKQIEIDHRFIRDHIQNKNIRLLPLSTIDQITDIFTKPLSTPRFLQLRLKLTVAEDPSVCGDILEHQNSKTQNQEGHV